MRPIRHRRRLRQLPKAAIWWAVRRQRCARPLLTSAKLGFETEAHETADVLISRYAGDAEIFVNCGQLVVDGLSESAAAQQLTISAFPDQPAWKALRQMRLDARAVTKTGTTARGFRAKTDVTYVMTRTIDTVSASGAVLGTNREIISFESGGVGRFGNGLACQPTGVLEDQITTIVADAATLGGGIDGLTPMDEALPVDPAPPESGDYHN